MKVTCTQARLLGEEIEVELVDAEGGTITLWMKPNEAPRVGCSYSLQLHPLDNVGLYAPGTK